MKILVYGAGVLGCNLAYSLFKSKKDVTLLARNKWYEHIKEHGLTINDKLRIGKSNIKINVINELKEDDVYDIIFVVMQYEQVDAVKEILINNKSKNIVLVGNNMNASYYKNVFSNKKLYFGFYSAAGCRTESEVRSIRMNKITIGGNDKSFIEKVLDNSKVKIEWKEDMEGWLKCHAAFVLPLAFAAYYSDGNLKKLKKDINYINKTLDAMKECYDMLIVKGCNVPNEDYEFVTSKRSNGIKFAKLMFGTFLGKIAISDHSMSAFNEMNKLRLEFDKLRDELNFNSPNFDEIEKSIEKYVK